MARRHSSTLPLPAGDPVPDSDPVPDAAIPDNVDPDTFRQALSRHPAGVTIVTLPGPAGLTVTSFSSASLNPPLVSFYIGHGSSTDFAVNLMGTGEQETAALFARKGADRFGPRTQWRPGPGGLPLLAGATTHLLCSLHSLIAIGDHELVVGQVARAIIGDSVPPLLHHQGRFTRPESDRLAQEERHRS
jgi:flavin reductase (DIM6/NTAB) family NADH-FMN oxidoreductase RutF